jgi:hypothetical protein
MSAEYARTQLTPESRSPRCAHAPKGHHSRLSSALLPSALRDSEHGTPGNRSRDWHARLAELIGRGAVSEQELFNRARAVLGYYAYSEDAWAIMERLANSPSYTPESSASPLD